MTTPAVAEARAKMRRAAAEADAARQALARAEADEQARLETLGLGEPNGNGYTYAALRLNNGAEVMAKRSPNGVWWWETCLCSSDDRCRRWGGWDALLACVRPWKVLPLEARGPLVGRHPVPGPSAPDVGRAVPH